MQDARRGLSHFLSGVRSEIIELELRLEIEFGNPAVTEPANRCLQIEEALQLAWSSELAEMAVLLGVRSLLNAYKTAAAYLIVETRKSIEDCVEAGREDIDGFKKMHKQARGYYGVSKDVQVVQEGDSLQYIVQRIDGLIENYCRAIQIASRAWCR